MLVGREKERLVLERAIASDQSELVAIIGRRRVGKTFLVRSVYADRIRFETSGVQNASLKEQLNNFHFQLKYAFGELAPKEAPKSWQTAFFALTQCLAQEPSQHQRVLFFDELPWLAGKRSGFLNAFSFFWNMWAVQNRMVVVICGSAASWMIQKVVNHKGGLHNRITKQIILQAFTLGETEAYLRSKQVVLDRYQIVLLYMALGGIPHYLNEVVSGKSAIQNIEALCFSPAAALRGEFKRLYPALFDKPENHISIIKALASKRSGMNRAEILAATKLPDGGTASLYLEELVSSGFVSFYNSFGKKKKEKIYRLVDEYSLFYLQFMEDRSDVGQNIWQTLSQTQRFKAWSGYAFESICLRHTNQIKKMLEIGGIYAEASSFYKRGVGNEQGVQIDLLLDRSDNTINLFEIKFHTAPIVLQKKQAMALREKVSLLKYYTQTQKHIFLGLISPFGLIDNEHSLGLIDHQIGLDALFG